MSSRNACICTWGAATASRAAVSAAGDWLRQPCRPYGTLSWDGGCSSRDCSWKDSPGDPFLSVLLSEKAVGLGEAESVDSLGWSELLDGGLGGSAMSPAALEVSKLVPGAFGACIHVVDEHSPRRVGLIAGGQRPLCTRSTVFLNLVLVDRGTPRDSRDKAVKRAKRAALRDSRPGVRTRKLQKSL